MRQIEPVSISSGGFNFCKYGVAALLLIALVVPYPIRVALVAFDSLALLIASKVGVDKSPMVRVYELTLGRWITTKPVMLDKKGMKFAHALGAGLTTFTLALLLLSPKIGYMALVLTALLKIISALGHCSALKLYGCLYSETCCQSIKKVRI